MNMISDFTASSAILTQCTFTMTLLTHLTRMTSIMTIQNLNSRGNILITHNVRNAGLECSYIKKMYESILAYLPRLNNIYSVPSNEVSNQKYVDFILMHNLEAELNIYVFFYRSRLFFQC